MIKKRKFNRVKYFRSIGLKVLVILNIVLSLGALFVMIFKEADIFIGSVLIILSWFFVWLAFFFYNVLCFLEDTLERLG